MSTCSCSRTLQYHPMVFDPSLDVGCHRMQGRCPSSWQVPMTPQKTSKRVCSLVPQVLMWVLKKIAGSIMLYYTEGHWVQLEYVKGTFRSHCSCFVGQSRKRPQGQWRRKCWKSHLLVVSSSSLNLESLWSWCRICRLGSHLRLPNLKRRHSFPDQKFHSPTCIQWSRANLWRKKLKDNIVFLEFHYLVDISSINLLETSFSSFLHVCSCALLFKCLRAWKDTMLVPKGFNFARTKSIWSGCVLQLQALNGQAKTVNARQECQMLHVQELCAHATRHVRACRLFVITSSHWEKCLNALGVM